MKVTMMEDSLLNAFESLDITTYEELEPLTKALESISKSLAQSEDLRRSIGVTNSSIWVSLRKLWRDTAEALVHDVAEEDERSLPISFATSLARFTRNLIAGVEENQEKVFEVEPDIRRMLHYQTSFVVLRDEQSHVLTRLLIQTLSNIVTSNQALISELWNTYMSLPDEHLILTRLLASPDEPTLHATLILVTNCIHGSKKRTKELITSTTGGRFCVRLLDCMLKLYDLQEDSDGGRAFNVGYHIFSRVIEFGFAPNLFMKMSVSNEPVTPHQTTVLKLLDSYLQSGETGLRPREKVKAVVFLSKSFFQLATWAGESMQKALGLNYGQGKGKVETLHMEEADNETGESLSRNEDVSKIPNSPLQEIDPRLPQVSEALVLINQCIISLASGEDVDERVEALGEDESGWIDEDEKSDEVTGVEVRRIINKARGPDGKGFVERLIDLLQVMDVFLPRIHVQSNSHNNSSRTKQVPVHSPENPPENDGVTDPMVGFSYLKRDLVRSLGILCFTNKAVQDRVRICGGIKTVLHLCVIDERSPFLMEHAIFALRNLLDNNLENQAVVEAMKAVK